MKKIYFSSILLIALGLALLINGVIKKPILILIGLLILVIGVFRFILIKSASKENDIIYSDDMILKYLKKDKILYADMIEVYKRGNCKLLYGENDGVLLYDEITDYYYASARTIAAVKDILKLVKVGYNALITYEDIFDIEVEKQIKYNEKLIIYNWVKENRNSYNIKSNVEIRVLDKSYADVMAKHYSVEGLNTISYMESRINDGALGAFINDEIVGFIGIHPSRAIGMLEVFEEYRNRHIGTLLYSEYVNYLLSRNYQGLIFVQILEDNIASKKIAEKLNFTKASKPCYWYV